MTDHRRRHLASWVLAISLLAGCTSGVAVTQTTPVKTVPTSPNASGLPATTVVSPSSAPTWNQSQAAAIEVVNNYFTTGERLFADPSRYTEKEARAALESFTGKDMLDGNVALFRQLKSDGKRYEGAARLAWTQPSGTFGSGAGETVNVTVCRDPQGQALVDRHGKVLSKVPAAIREFEVRRDSSTFRVVGEKEGLGEPCP
jgi:hypothetical protein